MTVTGATLVGECNKPCVVLLHSSMSSSSQWKPYFEMLQTHYRVLTIDLCGYGTAANIPFKDYSLDTEVKRIIDILTDYGVSELSIVGHSFGGAVGLKLAKYLIENTETSVDKLILYEPVSFHLLAPFSDLLKPITSLLEVLEGSSEEKIAERFIDFWNGDGAYANYPTAVQTYLASMSVKVMADFSALVEDPTRLSDYVSLACDLNVIYGLSSPTVTQQLCHRLTESVARSQLIAIDGGHMSPLNNINSVSPVLAEILQCD